MGLRDLSARDAKALVSQNECAQIRSCVRDRLAQVLRIGPSDLQAASDGLKKVIRTLQERDVPADQMPRMPPYQFDDCAWVANRWSELLPMSAKRKQQLMALDNPLLRLELVNDILDRSGIST